MPKVRRKRRSYSTEKRNEILRTAQSQGMTAVDVQKRFGVTPVTYYSWRKKSAQGTLRARRGAGRPRGISRGGDFGLRNEIQARVRQVLRSIVRNEVSLYLDTMFGSKGERPRKA